jgi:hypothetical protein
LGSGCPFDMEPFDMEPLDMEPEDPLGFFIFVFAAV